MSIQSEITRINTNIANAYDAVVTMGGTIPQTQNTANLPDAIATLAQTDIIQLEWIEGTGVQYIDTGVKGGSSCSYEIKFICSSTSIIGNYQGILGYSSSTQVTFPKIFQDNNSTGTSTSSLYAQSYGTGSKVNVNLGNIANQTVTVKYNGTTVYLDGTSKGNLVNTGWGNENICVNINNTSKGVSKIFYVKMYTDGVLVRDFIPALRKSDYEVGLYDKVNNQFYSNSGLGYFKPGIKIAGYSILDYLQSAGAAWFDTGVSGGSKMEYHMLINTLGSKARNYEQYFAGDNSPVTHKVYMNGSTNTSPVLAQQANGVYWSGTSTANLNVYNNADAWHNISFYSDGKLYLDTTLKGTGVNNGWGTLSYYLFNSHSEPTLISSMRMRYLVMKTDGVIQRFYIPMRKESPITSNITFGVYDLVNDTFVPSASNTSFTANARMMIDDGTTSPYYSIPVVVPTPSTKTGSIANQIDRINENIDNAYDVCRQIGRTMPSNMNSVNLEPTILDSTLYTVTWKNYDGTILETGYYFSGETPVYDGINPTKPSDGTYNYAFDGWSPIVGPITGNTVYTAQFIAYSVSDTMYYKLDNGVLNLRNNAYTGYTDCSNTLYAYWPESSPWNNDRRSITSVVFDNVVSPVRCNEWFYDCQNLTTIANISELNTSNTVELYRTFADCYSLTNLDVSGFDTSNVTQFTGAFYCCESLTSLDFSNWDTSNATDMYQMFAGCSSLTSLDLSSFNTSNVTNMGNMFEGCSSLTYLDLSSFDMSNVTTTTNMFRLTHNVATAYCKTPADKVILDAVCQRSGVSWRFTVKQ